MKKRFRCLAYGFPLMGTSIDATNYPKELTRMYKGEKFGFCCAGCPEKWDKLTDSEKDAKLKDTMLSMKQGNSYRYPAHFRGGAPAGLI